MTQDHITTIKKIYFGPIGNQGNCYYPGGQAYGSELGSANGIVPSKEENFGMDKSIVDSFVGYMSMPLDKQNIKMGALDVKLTPGALKSIFSMASVYVATNPNLSQFRPMVVS